MNLCVRQLKTVLKFNDMNTLEITDKIGILEQRLKVMVSSAEKEERRLNDEEQRKFNELTDELSNLKVELRKKEDSKNGVKQKNMEYNFSLLKAIRNVANNKAQDEISSAVITKGAEEMRKSGINFVGQIQLPSIEERAAVTVAAEGVDAVVTDLVDVVKPLQSRNVMIQAGAKFVGGLTGDLQYPVMSNANVTWEGETAAAKDGNVTFTNVKLSPKRLTAVVPISKQFIVQDSIGAENAIREELVNAINSKLEATILGNGKGSATEPQGLFYTASSLDSVTDFKGLCDMEAGIEEKNVYGDLKYILAPKAKAALRNMVKGAKSTTLVYENGEVDGTPALSTSNVKNTNLAYGDFSQYIIANWGNIDLTVDTVTLAAEGQIKLIVNAWFDCKPLRADAIKVATLA